jgi:hypothetical protein
MRVWYALEAWVLRLVADWPGRGMVYLAAYLLLVSATLLVLWILVR